MKSVARKRLEVHRELSGGTGMSPGAFGGYYDDQEALSTFR